MVIVIYNDNNVRFFLINNFYSIKLMKERKRKTKIQVLRTRQIKQLEYRRPESSNDSLIKKLFSNASSFRSNTIKVDKFSIDENLF